MCLDHDIKTEMEYNDAEVNWPDEAVYQVSFRILKKDFLIHFILKVKNKNTCTLFNIGLSGFSIPGWRKEILKYENALRYKKDNW